MSSFVEGLRWERQYNILGKKASAKVMEAKSIPSGAIEITIQTSCEGPDGKVHHQSNSMTLTDPLGGEQLESFMRNSAAWLRKLLWEKPQIRFFVAQLRKADGNYMNLTCVFNIQQALTFISPVWVELAGLPKVGIFVPPENTSIAFPIHRAHLRFGKREFDTDIVAANVNVSCSIGANLVLQAAGESSRYLYDLFLTDVVRALGNVARAKQTTVLILGSYSEEGRERLELIRKALNDLDLEGVILGDFVDIHQQSLFEKCSCSDHLQDSSCAMRLRPQDTCSN